MVLCSVWSSYELPSKERRQNPPALGGHGEDDLAAELVTLVVGLALRDALHLRGVHAVELALVAALLAVEPLGEGEQVLGVGARPLVFALDVADDSPTRV